MGWTEETWEGGRVWLDALGRKSYVIRKMVDGKRYEVSTKASELRDAQAQYRLFLADPTGYKPGGTEAATKPVRLSRGLLEDYLRWAAQDARNTPAWLEKKTRYLLWWVSTLGEARDLRTVTTAEVTKALRGASVPGHRLAALRSVYSWLRADRRLAAAQDPTEEIVLGEPVRPAPKANVIRKDSEAEVVAELTSRWADIVRLIASSGLHVAEVERFARRGLVETLPSGDVALVVPGAHGGAVRVVIPESAAEYARAVLSRGPFSRPHFHRALVRAARKAGVEQFSPTDLRDTYAHRLIRAGVDPMAVSRHLRQATPKTVRRFLQVHGLGRKAAHKK